MISYIRHKWLLAWEGVLRIIAFDLDLYLQSHSAFQSHSDFTKKLLKHGPSCVYSTSRTVLDKFFPYLAQMITGMRGYVVHNDLWPWPVSFWSFCCEFENKTTKIGTCCHVHSTAYTVMDGCFPYLAQMITSMKGCVACNDLWPWPISSRSFSRDLQ